MVNAKDKKEGERTLPLQRTTRKKKRGDQERRFGEGKRQRKKNNIF